MMFSKRGTSAAEVQAAIDASIVVPGVPWITGNYYDGTTFFGGNMSTQAQVANLLIAVPIIPVSLGRKYGDAVSVDRIGIEVTTAGAAGKKARLGMYTMGADGKPGALLVDAGEVAIDAIAGVEKTISQTLRCGDIYFRVYISDGTPTVRTENAGGVKVGSSTLASASTFYAWTSSLTYTAGTTTLPDPFPASPSQSGLIPRILLRKV
jgi:hypothetical protein